MTSKKATAVLHCTTDQPQKVIDTGQKVSNGMYEDTADYATPTVDKVVFNNHLADAVKWQGLVKGGGDIIISNRDTAIEVLFNDLDKECFYVNGLYKGNKTKLILSGFDVVDEAVPMGLPPVPVVQRIVSGDAPHSAKFYLTRSGGTEGKKMPGVTTIIQMAEDPSEEKNFVTVLECTNQNKLQVDGLTRGKEVHFRLRAKNRSGYSDWTDVSPFMPQ
jgi:hypothetical protein